MLKVIVIAVVLIVAAILVLAARQADTFHIERTVAVSAPPEKIVPLIDDFHQWAAWSPFEKYDPAMKKTYGGAPSGKGATYEWQGNAKAGAGRMEITHASMSNVDLKLDFLKPFPANHTARFTLAPNGNATNVTWSMDGKQTFVTKVMSVFMSMDKMVGKDFESGLDKLKELAEKA